MNPWVKWVAALLLVLNVVSFVLMGADKARAKRGAWRIPERTLFLSAALFGAAGGTLGMYAFRHKTQHTRFKLGFPALLAVQVIILVALGIKFL